MGVYKGRLSFMYGSFPYKLQCIQGLNKRRNFSETCSGLSDIPEWPQKTSKVNCYVMVHAHIWLLDPLFDAFKDKWPQKWPQMTSEAKGH